ncbi:MAG: GIY-YIG nuclease family protein [Chitinophagaceae bacterium]|nr:GIY-YIG nuclease family protein [Chitinophagaceae bacterium]
MKTGAINPYCAYITSNPNRTVFYTGVTNDLERRVYEHQQNRGNKKTFAGRYFCYELVYYECYPNMQMAIKREDEIKDLSREKKVELIKTMNPKMKKLLIG